MSERIESALVHALIALALTMVGMVANASETCSAQVTRFYLDQVSYEQATTDDARADVATEIEAQYDCELN